MIRTPIKSSLLLLLPIAVLLLLGCGSSEMKDFSLDTIEAQPEARLKILADTSITLRKIAQYSSTRQQLDSLIYYANWLKNYEENTALFYALMAYDLATEENLNFHRGVSAYLSGTLKGRRALYGEDIEDAMVDAKIGQRLLVDYNCPDIKMYINHLMGFLYSRQMAYDTARHYFNQALYQLDKLPIDSTIFYKNKATFLHNIATTFDMMEDSATQSRLYIQSDSLFQLIDNEDNRIDLWLDWALFYKLHRNYNKADSLYMLCLELGTKKKDKNFLATTYQEIGHLYFTQFESKEDKIYFDKSIQALRTCLKYENEKDFQYFTYQHLGSAFQHSWYLDFEESHVDSAILYYKLAIIKAREEGAKRTLKTISNNLSAICAFTPINCDSMLGEKAVNFINYNYMGLLDTLTSHSKSAFQRINKVEQRDIRVSAANNRKKQLYIGLGILSAIGGLFILAFQGQQNRRLKAEMEALRAQINPHFISNSLNAIESLVNLGNAKAAAKYLVHFSRLSRQILNGSRSATTVLSEELKTLKHFLALEQLRFRDKLTYEMAVAPEVNQELVLVPAMILQPYVENAIWHGIKPKQTGGQVLVKVEKVGKKLRCIIEDNGIGRAAADEMRKASVLQHKSMGMQITEERLKGMGRIKGSQVAIEDLIDEAGNPCGTRVILQFPYKLKKGEKR